jgi:hypothetical protein
MQIKEIVRLGSGRIAFAKIPMATFESLVSTQELSHFHRTCRESLAKANEWLLQKGLAAMEPLTQGEIESNDSIPGYCLIYTVLHYHTTDCANLNHHGAVQ